MKMYAIVDEDNRLANHNARGCEMFFRKIDAKDCCPDDCKIVTFQLKAISETKIKRPSEKEFK